MTAPCRKKQTLREGAAVLLLASIATKLIGALFKIPLSSDKVLGDLGFGYFSLAYDIYSPLSTLAISGIPVAISRVVADCTAHGNSDDIPDIIKISNRFFCGIGTVLSLSVLALTLFSLSYTDRGDGIFALFAVVPAFPICFWVSVKRGYFEGLRFMTCTALSCLAEALGKLILGLGFAVITLKLTDNTAYAAAAAIFGIALGMLLSGVILKPFDRQLKSDKKNSSFKESSASKKQILRKLVLIALPIALASLTGGCAALIDAVTVKRLLLRSFEENTERIVGIYSSLFGEYRSLFGNELLQSELPTLLYGIKSKAYTLYNLIPTLTVSFGISAIPTITEAVEKKCAATAENEAITAIRLSSLTAFPAAIGLICMGEPIMRLLYGKGFSSAIGGKMLSLYGIAAPFGGLMLPLGCVLQAFGKQRAVLVNAAISVAVKLILNLVLCSAPFFNIYGAALSTLLFALTYCMLNFAVLIKTVSLKRELAFTLLKPLVSAALCGITAYCVSLLGNSAVITLAAIASAACVYILTLIPFGAFADEDIAALPKGERLLNAVNKLKNSSK